MKNIKLKYLVILVLVFSFIIPSNQVNAATYTLSNLSLEVNISDDVIVLTKDVASTDPKWTEVGITDVKKKKNEMKKMNISALFYDKKTNTTVQLLSKDSNQSRDILNLAYLDDAETKKFYDSLKPTDDSTKSTVDPYTGGETPFFRYSLTRETNGKPENEIIYGTIMNGYLVWYDIYTTNTVKTIDESFIQSLVNSTHFTYVMSTADYKSMRRESKIFVACILAFIIGVIAFIVYMNKRSKKKRKIESEKKAKQMQAFYNLQKEKEDQNITPEILYKNKTLIKEPVIKNFYMFTVFKSRILYWTISALLCIFILFFLSHTNNGLIKCAIAIVIIFVYIYSQGVQIEKSTNMLMKRFDKKKGSMITTHFYDDYLVMYYDNSPTKYAYVQLTDIKINKNFIYLYYSVDQAIYLDKDGFEGDADQFINFVTEKFKQCNQEKQSM